jgi:ribosomal protein S18 acetylase RimI-like enzyme
MDPLESRHSPSRELAEAADANFVAHAGCVQRRLAGMSVIDDEDLVLIDSGLDCDTFNVICRARLDGESASRRAGEAIDHFRAARRPFSWWVGPADEPTDLGKRLVACRLALAETELAMAAELDGIPSGVHPHPDLRILRVDSKSRLRDFAEISAANWSPPDVHVLRFYELGSAVLLADDCPMRLYVGYLEDEAVACAEMTTGGGVAGLYNISTAARHRRRGIGASMTVHSMLEARDRGLGTAIVQAAAEGKAVYERVGFRPFGTIREYKPVAG